MVVSAYCIRLRGGPFSEEFSSALQSGGYTPWLVMQFEEDVTGIRCQNSTGFNQHA